MKRFIKVIIILCIVLIIVVGASNLLIIKTTSQNIYTIERLPKYDYDCIIVLGAGVVGNHPSPILRDRLDMGYQLYLKNVASKLLLSGDHHTKDYNEVGAMRDFMIAKKVDKYDIFMDHAGLSTYESMIRAKRIFGIKRMVIVTQQFHVNRALYLAKCVGIDAVAVPAEDIRYSGEDYRNSREVLARTKDFFMGIAKPKYYIDGETIDIKGDGNLTEG